MAIALFSILIALLIGFGAVQDIVRGARGGEVRPLLIGLAGMIVSVLLTTSGIAFWQGWATARRLVLVAAVSSVAFHVYAALPPHRNIGIVALLVGVGYGLVLLWVALSSRGGKTQTV